MPTYEYRCDECEHKFEEFRSITADPADTCPECGGPVQRLISAGNGFIFKGSGFYITDYKKSSSGSTSNSESKSDTKSESEAKPEKKESKPEKKSNDS